MEIWKPVVGYERLYEVSDSGRVRSLREGRRFRAGHIMSPNLGKFGYTYVNLNEKGIRKTHKIHRLVAQAFLPNPENKPDVNHKNGVKHDNKLGNLEWATKSENTLHAFRTGLHSGEKMRGHKNGFAKLSYADIASIFFLRRKGWTHERIGKEFNVSRSNIGLILAKKSWTHLYETSPKPPVPPGIPSASSDSAECSTA